MSAPEQPDWKSIDVTRHPDTTGISIQPTDQGLDLDEEPLDLAGSAGAMLNLIEEEDFDKTDAE